MKKILFLAATALLFACSNENQDDKSSMVNATKVTLFFSPYDVEPMTRASTSIASIVTRLDVWVYESGAEFTAVHQSSADDGFGSVSLTLDRTKTYTLVAVGHKCNSAASYASNIISFPDEKVSHAMVYHTTFSPANTTNINALMTRIVGQLRFEVADEVPAEAYTMRFSLGDCFTRWNVSTSAGANAVERTVNFVNFSRANDGTVAFMLYVIPTNLTDTDQMDITVTAMKENGDEIEAKTFNDVPIKAGYKTTYHGEFFTTESASASFTVESDFTAFDVVNF